MTTISAVIVAFNEEANIKACLESVKWTDEIILVDSFSTDKTVEIAKQYSAKIFQKKWKGFAADKDFGVTKAASEWIVLIDADERITEKLKEEIKEKLNKVSEYDGYFIPRKNYFSGKWIKHCGWYPNYMLRLFKKDKGRHDKREVHERVVVEGKVGYLKELLEHYSYKSVSDYRQRFDRYTSLEAQEMMRNNARVVWLIPFRELLEFFLKYRASGPSKHKMSAYLLAKEIFKNKVIVIWAVLFQPLFKFIWMYVFRLGFLDGYRGFLVSAFSSIYAVAKYVKFWKLRGHQTATQHS